MLCGPMGSGKSSVGRALAARLAWRFLDTDALIEVRAGRPIPEIFAEGGEAEFRALERAVLAELPDTDCVIALGGGAVGSAANRETLRSKGLLVWLDAPPEVLADRVGQGADRPLLRGLDRVGRIARLRELASERASAYSEADFCIETAGRGVDGVCDALLDELGRRASEEGPS